MADDFDTVKFPPPLNFHLPSGAFPLAINPLTTGYSTNALVFHYRHPNPGSSNQSAPHYSTSQPPADPGKTFEDLRRPAKRVRHLDTEEESVPAKRVRLHDTEEDDAEVGTKNEEGLSNGGNTTTDEETTIIDTKTEPPKKVRISRRLNPRQFILHHDSKSVIVHTLGNVRHMLSLPFPQEIIEKVIGNLDFRTLGLACMGKDERTKKEKKSDATVNEDVRQNGDVVEANGFAGIMSLDALKYCGDADVTGRKDMRGQITVSRTSLMEVIDRKTLHAFGRNNRIPWNTRIEAFLGLRVDDDSGNPWSYLIILFRFLLEIGCHGCGGTPRVSCYYWTFGLRMCKHCLKDNLISVSKHAPTSPFSTNLIPVGRGDGNVQGEVPQRPRHGRVWKTAVSSPKPPTSGATVRRFVGNYTLHQ